MMNISEELKEWFKGIKVARAEPIEQGVTLDKLDW